MTKTLEAVVRRRWLSPEEAVREVVAFERRFGEEHFKLACHCGLLLILTPELVNLVRVNFLEDIPWIAESNFLLSSLCRPLQEGIYEVEPCIREVLLVELENKFGWQRPFELAEFLWLYLDKQGSRKQIPELKQVQQWVAKAYLKPDSTIREFKAILDENLSCNNEVINLENQGAKIPHLIEILADPLEATNLWDEYQYSVNTSRAVTKLLVGEKEGLREDLGELTERELKEGEFVLISPVIEQLFNDLSKGCYAIYRCSPMPINLIDTFVQKVQSYFDKVRSNNLLNTTNIVIKIYDGTLEIVRSNIKSFEVHFFGSDILNTKVLGELNQLDHAGETFEHQVLVPCNCQICQNQQSPHYYDWDYLTEVLINHPFKATIQCPNSYDTINIRELMYIFSTHFLFRNYLETKEYNIVTYDSDFLSYSAACSKEFNSGVCSPELILVHNNMLKTVKFLKEVCNRDGIDGKGDTLVGAINVSRQTNEREWREAVWLPRYRRAFFGQKLFDDGYFYSYGCSLEIVANTLIHGLISCTSRLKSRVQRESRGESWALSESYADIFSILIKNYDNKDISTWNWEFGEPFGKNHQAVRNLSNPSQYGDPEHMNDYLSTQADHSRLHIHIHTNCSIHSKAAYNLITSIDHDTGHYLFDNYVISNLFYITMITKLNAISTFEHSLMGLLATAASMFRKDQKMRIKIGEAIKKAFDLVGI